MGPEGAIGPGINAGQGAEVNVARERRRDGKPDMVVLRSSTLSSDAFHRMCCGDADIIEAWGVRRYQASCYSIPVSWPLMTRARP